MPGVGPPRIGVGMGEPKGLQQRFERHKDLGCAAPQDGGEDLAGVVIDGLPAPARVAFVPNTYEAPGCQETNVP
jgi:hypothetical protein